VSEWKGLVFMELFVVKWKYWCIININNIQLYITRALSPAKYLQLKLMKRKKSWSFLKLEEVSKAIGRGGHNIKLAGLLLVMS
jgi:transcription antitermination factor NusA-like protein